MNQLIQLSTSTLPTSSMVKDAANKLQEQVAFGTTSVTDAESFVKVLEDFCKEYRKNTEIKQMIKCACDEAGGKITLSNGATIQTVITKKWDYTFSDKWRELQDRKTEIDEEIKSIEGKIKACAENNMSYTEEGGNVTEFDCTEQVSIRTTLPKK